MPCNRPSGYLIRVSVIEGNQTGAWDTWPMKEALEQQIALQLTTENRGQSIIWVDSWSVLMEQTRKGIDR